MHIIGIDLKSLFSPITKNLKTGWFPFGNFCTLPKNGEKYLFPDWVNSVDKLYNLEDDAPLVSINCIVGKNGSGKSTLVELLLYIINFVSYTFQSRAKDYSFRNIPHPNYSEFDVDFYYEVNNQVCRINLQKGRSEATLCIQDDTGNFLEYLPDNLKKMNCEINEISLKFFYTIYNNYSFYSFGNKTETEYLKYLFDKNDGYFTPITINPYRAENTIDYEREAELLKIRLITMFLLLQNQGVEFIDNYEACKLTYRRIEYEKTYKEDVINSFEYDYGFPKATTEYLIDKCSECWKNKLKDNDFIYDYDDEKDLLFYLSYKTLKILQNYPSYLKLFPLVIDVSSYENVEKNDKVLSSAVDYIFDKNNQNHIVLKIHQCLNYIKRKYYTESEKEIKVSEFLENNRMIDKKLSYKVFDEIYEILPPPFFEYDLLIKNRNGKGLFHLNELSSGETQLLNQLSTIVYHLKNLESISEESYRVQYEHVQLIFDEAELYFHPEYQRTYLYRMISILKNCHINKARIKSLGILLITHSPFIVSDIFSDCLLCLNDGKRENLSVKSFSNNYYDLLKNQFFLDYSVGEYGKKLYEYILHDNNANKVELKVIDYYIENIGDEFIKQSIKNTLYKKLTKNVLLEKKKQLQQELEELELHIKE